MNYTVQMFTNVALAGINTSITNYFLANPTAVLIFSNTIHDGVNFQSCLIVKL